MAEADEGLRTLKTAIIAGSICFSILIMGMVGCTMHSNAVEPEKIAAKAEVELAKSKTVQAEADAIERLIKEHNVGAVAARCAIKGWSEKDDKNSALVCAVAGAGQGGKGLGTISGTRLPSN